MASALNLDHMDGGRSISKFVREGEWSDTYDLTGHILNGKSLFSSGRRRFP